MEVAAPLHRLPLFVRGGALVPTTDTPHDDSIENRRNERLKVLKALFSKYIAYQKLAFPLKTYLIPGTAEDTQSTEFVTKLRVKL